MCWTCIRHSLDMYQTHIDHVLGMCWTCIEKYWTCIGHILDMYCNVLDMLVTCFRHVLNMFFRSGLDTFWTYIGHVFDLLEDMHWICFWRVLDMYWACFGRNWCQVLVPLTGFLSYLASSVLLWCVSRLDKVVFVCRVVVSRLPGGRQVAFDYPASHHLALTSTQRRKPSSTTAVQPWSRCKEACGSTPSNYTHGQNLDQVLKWGLLPPLPPPAPEYWGKFRPTPRHPHQCSASGHHGTGVAPMMDSDVTRCTFAHLSAPWYIMVCMVKRLWFMIYDGIPWYEMVYHGMMCRTVVHRGIPCYTVVDHGRP